MKISWMNGGCDGDILMENYTTNSAFCLQLNLHCF